MGTVYQNMIPRLFSVRLRLVGKIPGIRSLAGRICLYDDSSILVCPVYDYLSLLKNWVGRFGGEPFVEVNHFNKLFLGIKKGAARKRAAPKVKLYLVT